MIDLKFLGIGGASAVSLGGNCAYIKKDETLLLIDCCEEATTKLKDKNAFDDIKNVIVAITHTHFDHVAGLGTLIWFCNDLLQIKPKIVANSPSFETHLRKLLKLVGMPEECFEFVSQSSVKIGDCKVEMQHTTHTPTLECFGVMLSDNDGKYYYTGDTNDFETVCALTCDDQIKKIYCETCFESHGAHIEYLKLKQIKSNKLILMHFENAKLYELAKKDGFNVAEICN